MTRPDPTACCPDAYWCPTDDGEGETECPRHGGFDVCCAKPEAHVPMDRAAWHLAQERLEQAALLALYREAKGEAAADRRGFYGRKNS